VVATPIDSATAWRVPIHAFSGIQDGIVVEDSARGPFDSVIRVRGNHFTVIRPDGPDDERYREFTELLLDPGGHTQRFEIEKYETVLRVEPRSNEKIVVTSTREPRTVIYDNYATLNRRVRFAGRNCCKNTFTIRYATQKFGYVIGHEAGPPNIAPPDATGRWEDTGLEYQYDFIPEPEGTYGLLVEIYRGYDQGERTAHFHLNNHSRYRLLEYTLDLSSYCAAGYQVCQEPRFYFHPEQHSHGGMCRNRPARDPIPPVNVDASGVWKWQLSNIQQGIVDIVWDVIKP
jgi:hypothetical protein